MSLFGKSFEEQVTDAVNKVRASVAGLESLTASVSGKVVTLEGEAADMGVKTRAMEEVGKLVETENTINRLHARGAAPPPPAAAATPTAAEPSVEPAAAQAEPERIHEVVAGETLGKIAQHYYGKASLYPKIFEANRDVLSDPDKIKVGQRLRVPE